MARKVRIIDSTLRDGQQSLWATRMTTAMMYPILPVIDRAGYDAVEFLGTAVMDSCVRYLKENPWERIRLVRSQIRRTRLQMISICIGFSVVHPVLPDDVMSLLFTRCAANGVDRFFIMDGLNDMRNMEVPFRAIKGAGKEFFGAVVYSISPVHTDEHFVEKARELMRLGVDGIVLKDPNGLLTPDRVRTLVPALKAVTGDTPLYCHSHCLTGLGPLTNLEAVDHGVDGIWTAASPLANGSSLPSTASMVRHLRRRGYAVDIDMEAVEQEAAHFAEVARQHNKPIGQPAEYDPSLYEHQMPGGMISNFRAQLAELGLEDRLDAVLEEIPAVREDLGWAIMVTPFSQLIATQAALNVLYGRYTVIADDVKKLIMGYYGRTPGPVNPDLIDKVGGGKEPVTERPGALMPPAVERVRRELGPFTSDEDLLLSLLFMPNMLEEMYKAGPIRIEDTGGTSLVDVIREAAKTKGVREFVLVHR